MVVPTYCVVIMFLCTRLAALPLKVSLGAMVMAFALTCILPIIGIYLLYRLGNITDTRLNEKSQRTIPFVIAILCYLGCALYFGCLHAPWWLPTFMVAGAIAVLVTMVVNLRWKISAHATAMGGMVALLFSLWGIGASVVNMMPLITVLTVLAGVVGSARILLGYHTLAQVLAGFANGILWMAVSVFAYTLLFIS